VSNRNLSLGEGYTLVEMLVVLGLVALIFSVSLPAGMRGRANHSLDSQAMKIVAMLKAARIGAISRNAETLFEADLAHRNLSATGVSERLQLSNDIALSMLTARKEVQSGMGAIRFFPDGSSTGGSLNLVQGKLSTAVVVDWLTGRITRKDTKAD
jgi:general secretion pathway protein H